ncbi:hypothetical protein LDC_1841, partial [sediment metagenome]
LTKRHAWFGRHSFAGSWQHNDNLFGNGTMGEYNIAPGNTQPIDSATNIILRRTYLDFWTPGGQRGALDPWANPIPEAPGMKAAFIWNNAHPWNQTVGKSWMIATQSRFPGDRIVLTAGYRRERIENNNASLGGERLPNSTNLWLTRPYRFDPATVAAYDGATKTFGAVVMPLPWLGLTYNQSESAFPQSNFTDIYDRLLVPRPGRGARLCGAAQSPRRPALRLAEHLSQPGTRSVPRCHQQHAARPGRARAQRDPQYAATHRAAAARQPDRPRHHPGRHLEVP